MVDNNGLYRLDATNISLNPTNNVGIGTTSPSEKLDVEGNIRVGVNNGFYINNQNVGIKRVANDLVVGGFGGIRFTSSSTTVPNQAERMRITSAGNVGIGTTSPTHKLEVIGDSNDTMRVYRPGSRTLLNIDADAGRTSALSIDIAGISQYYVGMPTQAVSGLGARFAISYQGDPSFVLEGSTGKIGIGTTSPGEKLDVDGNILADGLGIGNNTIYSNSINLNNAGSLRIGNAEFISKSSNDMSIFQSKMVVTSAGNVGIGTTSPSQKLEVDGEVLSDGYRVSAMQTAPAARNSTGTLGEIRITSNYIYVCYATNSWSRVALATSW